MLRVAGERRIAIVERAYSLDEALAADEAPSGLVDLCIACQKIDSKPIGDGKAGPFTIALRKGYLLKLGLNFTYQRRVR